MNLLRFQALGKVEIKEIKSLGDLTGEKNESTPFIKIYKYKCK